MYHDTTKEMWDAMNDTYSNVDNTSSIFKIKSLLYDLRQGESSITKYLNALNKDLDEVQGRVLGTNHSQSYEKCYQKYGEKRKKGHARKQRDCPNY